MRFRADRAELGAAQLDLLSKLEQVDPSGDCWEDTMVCNLSITDADATTRSYVETWMDAGCGTANQMVSFASFEPFRQALGCKYAKGAETTLSPDARCYNGMFTPSVGTTNHQKIEAASSAEAIHLELDDCAGVDRAGHIKMQLFSGDGMTLLGDGAPVNDPGVDGACLRLDTTVPAAGTYDLVVVTDPAFLPAGDFYLRFW